MNEKFLLQIDGLVKSFSGITVLKSVQLNVRPGTVHSLMGENGAGKSTMMKCLFGIYKQDNGNFYLNGEEFNFTDPKHALESGVSMVHQELNQVLQRSVIDNVWLGRYPKKGFFVDEEKMLNDTIDLFKSLNIELDPTKKMSDLSVSQRQMVEIAKAVSYDASVIVLDEPTSSLTENEVNKLFEIINTLKSKGCGIVYISHKMEEIFEISDDVTVLRDGEYIGTEPIEKLDMDKIIAMMVGRDLEHRFPPKDNVPHEVHMEVRNIKTKYKPRVMEANFDLHKGEILGIYGLVGARRTELLEALFGVRTLETGEIYIDGELIDNSTPVKSLANRFALLTEERRATGIFPVANIRFNSTIANIHSYTNRFNLLNEKQMQKDTDLQIQKMNIRCRGQFAPIRELSGGNQQKVIIGKWLLCNPDILMLDEPTRGIDVGAKYEIYQLIIDLAKQGKSIIMVSSEMPELIGITDRIMVMSNGYVSGITNTKNCSQEEILKLSTKHL